MPNDDLDVRRRRCLFRATHRGTKEMDWLLGSYAQAHLPAADAAELTFWERLSSEEMDSYIASREWKDKAGGYAIQGIAAAFARKITGSYTNVVGLPLHEVVQLLTAEGFPVHYNWLRFSDFSGT